MHRVSQNNSPIAKRSIFHCSQRNPRKAILQLDVTLDRVHGPFFRTLTGTGVDRLVPLCRTAGLKVTVAWPVGETRLLCTRTIRDGRRSAWSQIFSSGEVEHPWPSINLNFHCGFRLCVSRTGAAPRGAKRERNRRLDSAESSAPIDETAASSDVVIGRNQQSPLVWPCDVISKVPARIVTRYNLSRVRHVALDL